MNPSSPQQSRREANKRAGRSEARRFFYLHSQFSFDPTRETPEQGRRRCARELAQAEAAGRAAGLSFRWSSDTSPIDNESPSWGLWVCECIDRNGTAYASLRSIDLGRNGIAVGDPYARVVEAELASEALG